MSLIRSNGNLLLRVGSLLILMAQFALHPVTLGLVVCSVIVVGRGCMALVARSKAISALKATDAINSPFALVRSIIRLCQRGWVVDFVRISREANHVVDHLIKRISMSQFKLVHFESSPPDLAALLMRDIDGPPYCRSASN
ncbi:hypothetical protein V6N13_080211 [Hibiscus sabdariffa]